MQTVDQQQQGDAERWPGRRPGTHIHIVHTHTHTYMSIVTCVTCKETYDLIGLASSSSSSSCSSTRCAPDTLIDATATAAAAAAHANGATVGRERQAGRQVGTVGVGLCTVNCLAVSIGFIET